METKPTLRFHLTPLRMAIIKKTNNKSQRGLGRGREQTLYVLLVRL
jgi:hypothetical protein